MSVERRLAKDPVLGEKFTPALEEFGSRPRPKAHRRKAASGTPGRIWHLPVHAVTNPNKPGKCHPVFGVSAEFNGTSLNSQLLKDPDLLTNLLGVLIRSRQYPVAVSADIVKMFHQVRVRPEDASTFRFLWRKPGSTDPPDTYQINVQTF